MRYLILGANGLIGRNVVRELSKKKDDVVFAATRKNGGGESGLMVDLLEKETIASALEKSKPDIIIHCAGIITNNEDAILKNPMFTLNLLQTIMDLGMKSIKKIVILGSAAEYGELKGEAKRVNEETSLRATSPYGISKILEVSVANRFREEYGMPVVVARPFNPLGYVENSRQLIPRILQQVQEIKQKKRDYIEVTRLDSERDYMSVKEIARAIVVIAGKVQNNYHSYNIGSGESTTNREVVEAVLRVCELHNVEIKETSSDPEPKYAAMADVGRLTEEFDWESRLELEKITKEIIDEEEKNK